jgi:hypothetical protein
VVYTLVFQKADFSFFYFANAAESVAALITVGFPVQKSRWSISSFFDLIAKRFEYDTFKKWSFTQ